MAKQGSSKGSAGSKRTSKPAGGVMKTARPIGGAVQGSTKPVGTPATGSGNTGGGGKKP